MNLKQQNIITQKNLKYEAAGYGLPFHGNVTKGLGWPKHHAELKFLGYSYSQKLKYELTPQA